MNRKEKIELLNSVKNGTPFKYAFGEHTKIYNTLDEPDIYYNESFEIVNLEYYKKNCKNLFYITTVNIDEAKKISMLHQKFLKNENSLTIDELNEAKKIIENNYEFRKKVKNHHK